jgi:membrane associated rhomboid family serine protease
VGIPDDLGTDTVNTEQPAIPFGDSVLPFSDEQTRNPKSVPLSLAVPAGYCATIWHWWPMHSLLFKLRSIYLPFLLIALGCVVGYSLLNWLLLIDWQLFAVDDEVVDFWLPYCVPWIPILIWLRPRLKLLRLEGGRGNLPGLYYVVAAFAIAAPTIVAQHYLATATGTITDLERISQVTSGPSSKYYRVREVFVDKADTSIETRLHLTGRYNENLAMDVLLACPLDDAEDTRAQYCDLWLGTVYKTQVSSHLSDTERETQLRAFVKSSLAAYGRSDLRVFSYLERVGAGDEARGFQAAAKHSYRFRPDRHHVFLSANSGDFDARNGNKLAWIFGSFGIGGFVWLLMILVAPIERKEMSRQVHGGKASSVRSFPWYRLFIPKGGYFATPILIDLNLLVFAGMVLAGLGFVSFSSHDLLELGGNFRPAVQNGEIWRLVTGMFIHGGVFHLAGNVFGLLFVGLLLEPVLDRTRFIICYFLCGVSGSIASVMWNKATVSVGASGAIFGLWGILIGLSLMNRTKVPLQKNQLLKAAAYILGYNLLFGLASVGIDNADHLGGLVSGALIGVLGGVFPRLVGRVQVRARSKRNGHSGEG